MGINYRQIGHDFAQKYDGTFVHVVFKPGQTPVLFQCAGVGQSDSGPPVLTLVNKEHGTVKLNYQTECEVSFPFPKCGYFWAENRVAAIFQRKHSRQYRRGICSSTASIQSPYTHFYPMRIGITEENLLSAFNPVFVQFLDAIEFIRRGNVLSVPLSSHLAIGASPSERISDYIIWFLGKPIATYNNGVIRVREGQFMQEIVDYVKGSGVDAQIV